MVNLRTRLSRQIVLVLMALSLVVLPLTPSIAAYADDPAPCTPPAASTNFHYPNGADSSTFTYDCASGLWENPHFTYDPATGERTATDPIVYTCDPATNTYNVTTWAYSPSAGAFVSNTQNVSQPPAGANVVDCPPPPAPAATASTPTSNGVNPASVSSALNNPPSGGSSTTDNSLNNTANLGNVNNLNVNNTLTSTGLSGNAIALGNTTVGDVASGDATVVANELNMLQSSNNFGSSVQPVTFVANVNGDVNGDFLLDPSTIASVQPASTNNVDTSLNNALTINNTTNATLNNNLNLNAGSGDATANANTTTGNVTSGNADAVADVVNTIDSAISAGHSFLGVININGNLNGDILLPPDFVNQLLADNVPTVNIVAPGTGSTNTTNTTVNNSTDVTNTNNQGINNIVKATANTGTATADGNTTTGNIGTGSANTNITAFNLTGSQVIGSNDLLVFVNVLGSWVGLIVDAPPGTTAAELGGGITTTGPNSMNTTNTTVNNNANLNNKTNQEINNNIDVNATSGNASANRNTNTGNVTSGNAKVAVNLMNVENSSLSLSNWFGILFINVFGTWNGSFGINTAAGDPAASGSSSNGAVYSPVLAFVPKVAGSSTAGSSKGSGLGSYSPFGAFGTDETSAAASAFSSPDTVLAASTTKGGDKTHQIPQTPGHFNWLLAISGGSVLIIYTVGERFYAIRQQRLNS